MNQMSRGASIGIGALAGIVGTMAMATSQQLISAASADAPRRGRRLRRSGAGRNQFAQSEPRSHEHYLSTSEYLIQRVAPAADDRRRKLLGSLVHFGFGAGAGAAYVIASQTAPDPVRKVLTSARGLTFGTIVWLVADEIGVPMMGIAPKPWETPVRLHAYSLASHLAYGFATDLAARMLGRTMNRPQKRQRVPAALAAGPASTRAGGTPSLSAPASST